MSNYKKSGFLIYLNSGDTLSAAVQIANLLAAGKPAAAALAIKMMDRFLRGGYINEDGQYCDTPQSIKYMESQPGYVPRPQFYPNDPVGFQDPAKSFPKNHMKGEPDISRLARNERTRASPMFRKQLGVHRRVQSANRRGVWDQPIVPYNTKYPYNNVTQTESGHIMEMDDTPGSERVHLAHRTGSFIEMDATGTVVRRTVGEDYTIIEKHGRVHIVGNADVCVGGAKTLRVEGTTDVEVHGATLVNVHNTLSINVASSLNVTVGDSAKIYVLNNVDVLAGGNITMRAGGNIDMIANKITMTAGSVSISGGSEIAADAGAIHLNSGKAVPFVPVPIEWEPLGKLTPGSVNVVKPSAKTRSDEATSIYETPQDGTAAEVEAWKKKRVQEGTATRAELDSTPKTEDKAGAGAGTAPKPVNTTVPNGREFRSDDKISKYFTLGDMTKGYTRKLVDKLGVTQGDIFKNICYLAENVLDPIKEKYPNVVINSGFREEMTKSQHNIG